MISKMSLANSKFDISFIPATKEKSLHLNYNKLAVFFIFPTETILKQILDLLLPISLRSVN